MTVKLFCGHICPDKLYDLMFQMREVVCPKCNCSWRGTQVIGHDKSLAKKELRWALDRANESKKRKNQK